MVAEIRAWRPRVPGVAEVFHARFTEHAYPMHVHDTWTLLIVDAGAVRYDLGRREHGTPDGTVTLLPPHVPHNGAPATAYGFRKRVVYLEPDALPAGLIGPAVDDPDLTDPLLRQRIGQLHGAFAHVGEELAAESRLALIVERLSRHLHPRGTLTRPGADRGVARRLRDLLDARVVPGVTLAEAAAVLHAHPTHLVRAFGAEYGIAPHRYLTTRRVDRARRLLLDGVPPAQAAVAAGFVDQSHLSRHFTRLVGTTPGRYARSGAA